MTPFILTPEFAVWNLGTLGIIDLIAATTNAPRNSWRKSVVALLI